MGIESHAELIEAIQRFLDDAARAIRPAMLRAAEDAARTVDLGRDRGEQADPLGAAAQSLTTLPTCIETNALARKASLAAGYLFPKPGGRQPAGRPLDADALISTGLVGTLLDPSADLQTVASDLAGYLAGPPVDIWDYAILDGSGTLQDPIPVVDEWELVTPSADELRILLPLPSTAAHQHDRPSGPFDPDDYGYLAMLRRVNRDAAPQRGIALHLELLESSTVGHPDRLLWQPLIALSLYANPVLRWWAWYRIEPRRRTDKLFDSVEWYPAGETNIERPLTGAFDLDASAAPPLRRFLEELSPLLTAALSTQAAKKAANRLRSCAEHFLMAGDAHRDGEVFPQQNADAVLHYVIALESLLAGDDSDRSDLTRKVSQRAAVLAGRNDANRLAIEQLVRDAYKARSAYAHGSEPSKIDLTALRRIVRRCIHTRLILGDPTPTWPLHVLADRALLSRDELQSKIRRPLNEFARRWQAS